MLKRNRIKPFRDTPPEPSEVVDISSTLRKDRTPIPDKRFVNPPKYGITAQSSDTTDEYEYNGHEYIDLGLSSGTKWAKMNVGATSEKDAGLYFAWGETTGYTANQIEMGEVQKAFSWNDYALTEDGGLTFTIYNDTDNKTHLELTYDAATVNMGGDWHMPNMAQCLELFKETKNGFVTDAGAFTQYTWNNNDYIGYSSPTETTATISGWDTAGYLFFKSDVSDMDAAITSGDYLFVPAAGYCTGGLVDHFGSNGNVWTSALDTVSNPENAWYLCYSSEGAGDLAGNRYVGQSIRGVVGQMDEITDDGDDGGIFPS